MSNYSASAIGRYLVGINPPIMGTTTGTKPMATLREQFDEVYNSITNGQRRQAFDQMKRIGEYDMPELLEYLADELENPEMALDAAITYFRLNSR